MTDNDRISVGDDGYVVQLKTQWLKKKHTVKTINYATVQQ